MPVVEFGKVTDGKFDELGCEYKDNGTMPFLDGYTPEKLLSLYRIGKAISEGTEEIFKCYIDHVTLPYWNLSKLKSLGVSASGLEVSNYGKIKFNGIELNPVKGKIKILDIEFVVYRLVAEVFCNNPDPNIYDTVHHIGYDYADNSKNLLFVTKFQHDTLYEALNG